VIIPSQDLPLHTEQNEIIPSSLGLFCIQVTNILSCLTVIKYVRKALERGFRAILSNSEKLELLSVLVDISSVNVVTFHFEPSALRILELSQLYDTEEFLNFILLIFREECDVEVVL
jgi:hypothetical protein